MILLGESQADENNARLAGMDPVDDFGFLVDREGGTVVLGTGDLQSRERGRQIYGKPIEHFR